MFGQTHRTKSKLDEIGLLATASLLYDRRSIRSLAPVGQSKSLPEFSGGKQMPVSPLPDDEPDGLAFAQELLIEPPEVAPSIQNEYPSTFGSTTNFRDRI